MAVWLTMPCKTTHNIPSCYSYLKLAKLYVVLHEILRQMTIWYLTMKCILCSVREGGKGVDFRPEIRLMTLSDLKQENYVKCIKYKLIL